MTRSYRTRGAAGYLGVSKSWLDKMAAKGTGGPAYRKVGRHRIYDEPDLDAYKLATSRANKPRQRPVESSPWSITPSISEVPREPSR